MVCVNPTLRIFFRGFSREGLQLFPHGQLAQLEMCRSSSNAAMNAVNHEMELYREDGDVTSTRKPPRWRVYGTFEIEEGDSDQVGFPRALG
jgi:hypothetical protein